DRSTARKLCRSIVSLGRAHGVEGVHRRGRPRHRRRMDGSQGCCWHHARRGGRFGGWLAGAEVAAAPAPEITATTAPTLATSPTLKRISVSVPLVVDGTSIDVLSVSISNRLSPGFTASPAALNHFVILPSATVSPSCGIRTSTCLLRSLGTIFAVVP